MTGRAGDPEAARLGQDARSQTQTGLPRALFAGQWRWMLATIALSFGTIAAGTALLGLSGWFLAASALTGAGAAFNLFGPSAGVRGLSFLRILGRYGERLNGHAGTLKLLSRLRGWLYGALFPLLPLRDRNRRHGDLVSRLTADIDALDTAFLIAIGPVLTSVLAGLAMAALLAWLLPAAAPVYVLGLAAAVLLAPALAVLATRRAARAVVETTADARGAVLDAVEGHLDLLTLGAVGAVGWAFARSSAAMAHARHRTATGVALASGLVQAAAVMTLIGVLVAGSPAVATGSVSGPLFVGLALMVLGSFEATAALVRSAGRLGTALVAARRLADLAESAPSVVPPARPVALPAGGDIRLRGVRFGYASGRPVLEGLALAVPAGGRVAIMGESGSGKSTLLALLARLADPDAGEVRIAGTDIRTVAEPELRRRVALLGQDTPVFHDTIRANLLIARPDADDAALWRALADAQLDELVRTLPGGLEAIVGETGKTLSVGEARRLCLARMLLSEAAILLFDEPAAGLDPESEAGFYAALAQGAAGRTVLIVTHTAPPPALQAVTLTLRDGRLAA